MADFTWIPIYREVAEKLLSFKNDRKQLIEFLEEIRRDGYKTIGIEDQNPKGSNIRLEDIDPFTFLSSFNTNLTYDNRIRIIKEIKNRWDIFSELPSDFSGIPILQAQNSWFFPYKFNSRPKEQIPDLWTIFEQALNGNVNTDLFEKVVRYKYVTPVNLTIAFFWINPYNFYPLGKSNELFLRSEYDSYLPKNIRNIGWEKYQILIDKIKSEREGESFPELSYNARIKSWNKKKNEKQKENIMAENPKEKYNSQDKDEVIVKPLNLILYGPPGTGKTYHTITKALEIIDGEVPETRKKAQERFNKLKKDGQIEFVTFHQSFSYEDFVEGIKPIPPETEENQSNEMIFKVQNGIFKRVCESADFKNQFDKVYEEFGNYVRQNDLTLKTPVEGREFKVLINDKVSCIAKPKTKAGSKMIIPKEAIYTYLKKGIARGWQSYIVPIADFLKKKYSLKGFENSVLIIDEINRGNVASIFGELITLIEMDKRLGASHEITAKLPYSGEDFGVPANLHIVGTMNTADRSVEALDAALRRRFQFEEMMPKPEFFDKEEWKWTKFDIKKLLTTLNKRLEILLDRDHQIGHSCFMLPIEERTEEKLREIFKFKIIPQLKEFFFGDPEKMRLVLGNDFFEKESEKIDKLFDGIEIADYLEDIEERWVLTDSKNWKFLSLSGKEESEDK